MRHAILLTLNLFCLIINNILDLQRGLRGKLGPGG
jgi:hypothetical protein